MGVSRDQQGFAFRIFALRVEGLGNSYGGADQSKIQPLPIRAPYRGNGGECTWVKVHALHSLQLKGIRRAEKNFSFPTPTRYEELGEYGVLVFRTALLHFHLMIYHLYIV